MITIDHIGHTHDEVRALIAGLMSELDPTYDVNIEPEDHLRSRARIGLVLVDHRPPTEVFAGYPDALLQLRGSVAHLRAYETVEEVGAALAQAGIGLADFSLDRASDVDLAAAVLEVTQGLPGMMTPTFEELQRVARRSGIRPDVRVLRACAAYTQRLVELHAVQLAKGRVRLHTKVRRLPEPMVRWLDEPPDAENAVAATTDARTSPATLEPTAAASAAPQRVRASGRRPRTKAEVIKQRDVERRAVQHESKAVRRKSAITLPGV